MVRRTIVFIMALAISCGGQPVALARLPADETCVLGSCPRLIAADSHAQRPARCALAHPARPPEHTCSPLPTRHATTSLGTPTPVSPGDVAPPGSADSGACARVTSRTSPHEARSAAPAASLSTVALTRLSRVFFYVPPSTPPRGRLFIYNIVYNFGGK